MISETIDGLPHPITMSRPGYLLWAKERALALVEADPRAAWMSFASDCDKHPEIRDNVFLGYGTLALGGEGMTTSAEVRKYIEGFN